MGVLRAGERGQATVEAAFLIPVLFTVLLLSVQPGMSWYDRMVMRAGGKRWRAGLPPPRPMP